MLKDSISSPMASRNTLPIRGSSPTPSAGSGIGRSETFQPGQRSPAHSTSSGGKRSLLDKLRRHKVDGESHSILSHLPGSTASLHHAPSTESNKSYKSELAAQQDSARQGSVATFDSGSTAKASDYSSETLHMHLHLPSRRRTAPRRK